MPCEREVKDVSSIVGVYGTWHRPLQVVEEDVKGGNHQPDSLLRWCVKTTSSPSMNSVD